MSTIPVITDIASTSGAGALGMLDSTPAVQQIDLSTLSHSLADLSGKVGEMLNDVKQVGDFKLKELQVAVEISGEGGVALIGSVKAGAKGALTLTFSA